jgi:ELWxxDGT repeat protein
MQPFKRRKRQSSSTPSRRLQIESLEQRLTLSATLVRDINPVEQSLGVFVSDSAVVGNDLYLPLRDVNRGTELFKANATTGAISLVEDINPDLFNTAGSNPRLLTAVGSKVFFVADSPEFGTSLWRSDGTSGGTVAIVSQAQNISNLAAMNGVLYFSAQTSLLGQELWRADGTEAGTRIVRDINAGSNSSSPASLTVVNSTLYFSAETALGRELWRTDGTAVGTVLVRDIVSGSSSSGPRSLTAVGSQLFFIAFTPTRGEEVWVSNGTSSGTTLVKDLVPGSSSSYPEWLTNVNGQLYFVATLPSQGPSLWRSNGTSAGTKQIRIVSGAVTNPSNLKSIGNRLFFKGVDGNFQNFGLWTTDGTSVGTSLFSGGEIRDFGSIGNEVLISKRDQTVGIELFKRSITGGPETRVRDIVRGSESSDPSNFIAVGNKVFFTASTTNRFQEVFPGATPLLWRTDGTMAGTTQLRQPNNVQFPYSSTESGAIKDRVVLNRVQYFAADDGINGVELWRSDGTTAGTYLIANIGVGNLSSSPRYFTVLGDFVYFVANDTLLGEELWRTDGTLEGTSIVRDIQIGGSSSQPQNLTVMNGVLYFTAVDAVRGNSIWRSDGTRTGTQIVRSIAAGNLVVANNSLYFIGSDNGGRRVWRSDGTAAGTRVLDNQPDGFLSELQSVNNRLFIFSVIPPDIGNEGRSLLFSTDSTGNRVVYLADGRSPNVSLRGIAFFDGGDVIDGQLWRTDGTPGGTLPFKNLQVEVPNASIPQQFVVAGNRIFFLTLDVVGGESTNQRTVWTSDGTAAGTVPLGTFPDADNLTAYGGGILFSTKQSAADGSGVSASRIWLSDGTVSGTRSIASVRVGVGFAEISDFVVVGRNLLFTASTDALGRELWRVPLTRLPVVSVANTPLTFTEGGSSVLPFADAVLRDSTSPTFNRGRIIVDATRVSSADSLAIRPGNGVTLSGTSLLVDGVTIGTFRPGSGVTPLLIILNAQATTARIQTALRRITFSNPSDNPTSVTRTLTLRVSNGSTGISLPAVRRVTVVVVDNPPILAGLPSTIN